MSARRIERSIGWGLVALAVVAWALVRTYPNYDSYFHLVWGRELRGGTAPGFDAYAAPTEHPLLLALCALLGLIGIDADRALVLLCVVSLVALAWATFRVGEAVFGRWPGLAAAVFVGSSFAFLLYAARAYLDVPFLALVLWAAALEARVPRRGTGAMALLAVAGLLRPEAWLLAGAYWLWCGWRRWRLLVLAAVAPVAWAIVDLVVTGDPLFSLHATSELADELGRSRGVGEVPRAFVSFVVDTARPPVALAAVAGAVMAWRLRPGRALHVPIALLAGGAITFLATALAGLSVLPRYLTVPVVAVCLLGGYGVLGFTTLRPGPLRLWWTRAAVFAALAGTAFVAIKAPVVNRLAAELRFIAATNDDLRAVLRDPQVERSLACGPLSFPTFRLVPDARWALDLPEGRVVARSERKHRHGVQIVVRGEKAISRFGRAETIRGTNVADAGFRLVAERGMFAAYASCPS